ncbi:susD family protein [Arenibacter sp. NBRC 103722]|uniref:RagB/SusD family nutrient uptake outer membrane protein n=1 Tax=Arenibacter sp. NBRC 103722 TaxID=1113929 RepID=UPI000852D3CE|nr:RagB/SusD family nutrient uptake outer membrane protein [Arenibacter sp. NBRC 103722]GBF21823.1 susD family protein [Arenibacter sp. NBRC 103722]|tara:strand:- start:3262 stop:4911 length:1650 start_codon:yes stop_codon:yes gene_type:complete
MKNRQIKIPTLFAVLAFIISCDKELNLYPLDQVSDGSFWKAPSDFEKAANAFYSGLTGASGGYDQDSDIAVGGSSNTISNGSLILENGPGWSGQYATIRGTTRLIERYESALDIQSDIERYAAEARFFRAMTYHNLVSTFGDVPLVKRALDLDSEELDAPRAPRAEIVAYILEDLDWAIANLPLESELVSSEKGRVTKGAALALKSRVFLFEGTWSKYHGGGDSNAYFSLSIDASQKLIESEEYELYTGNSTNSAYRFLFLEEGEGSKESILARRYNRDLEISHNTTRLVMTFYNAPTKQLADMYVCTDGLPISVSPLFQGYDLMTSEFENRDPRMTQTMLVPGTEFDYLGLRTFIPSIGGTNESTPSGYMPFKFVSDNSEAQLGTAFNDYMAFRYAEVLLNHAEALYEKNGSISDSDLNLTINKLRDRVGVAHLTNSLVNSYGLSMLEQIRNERTVELAFEGFRFNDLRRWKQAENKLPVNLLGVKYTGTEYESSPPNDVKTIQVNSDGFTVADDVVRRTWDDKLYLFPVPVEQIQLNPNLLPQNPGW